MQKNKVRLFSAILVIAMVFSFSTIAYAYSPSITVQIYPVSGDMYFYGKVATNASASLVELITYDTESYDELTGVVLASYSASYEDGTANSISSSYTYEDAEASIYGKYVHGNVEHYNLPAQDFSDTEYKTYDYRDLAKSANASANITAALTNANAVMENRNSAIAESFNIDLDNYTRVKMTDSEFTDLNLSQLKQQIISEYGDTIPGIYINADNTGGVVVKQDRDAVNYLYTYESDGNGGWAVVSTDTVQSDTLFLADYLEEHPNSPTVTTETNGTEVDVTVSNNN